MACSPRRGRRSANGLKPALVLVIANPPLAGYQPFEKCERDAKANPAAESGTGPNRGSGANIRQARPISVYVLYGLREPLCASRSRQPRSRPIRRPMARASARRWKSSAVSIGSQIGAAASVTVWPAVQQIPWR